MNYKCIKNIESFKIDSFNNLYFSNTGEKQLYKNSIENLLISSNDQLSFDLFNDKIYLFQREDCEIEIYLDDDIKVVNIQKGNAIYFIKHFDDVIKVLWEGAFYNNLTKKDPPQLKRVYLNDELKWSIKEWGFIKIFENLCLLLTSENIKEVINFHQFSRLSFETGERLWDFDLDEHLDKLLSAYPYEGAWLVPDHHPQIKEPIGVYKDQLWFSMKHYGLLCLNYHTGAFMHYLRDCPENDKGWPYMLNGKFPLIPFTENAIIIENEGKIICFDSVMYWELNLETLQIDFHFLEDYLKNEVQCYTTNTRFKKLIVENERIYMVDNLHKKFGCFNRRTLKYDWIEPLPEGSGAPRSIEKHGNRLYIDTSKKELLVYELEGNE